MEESLIARLEAAVTRLERVSGRGGGGDDEKEVHPTLVDYDDFVNSDLKEFLAACDGIPEGQVPAKLTRTIFDFQRNVIEAFTVCKKPKTMAFQQFLQPIIDAVTQAQDMDSKADDAAHRKAFAEFSQFANWLLMPSPVSVVSNTLEAADFWLVKILTSARGLDDAPKAAQRAYVNSMKATIKAFAAYVKANFKMGPNWKHDGIDISEFKAGGAAPATGGAPPPPPAPAITLDLSATEEKKDDSGSIGGMGAVFAELNKVGAGANQGMAAALGLKKVTKAMKTKNANRGAAPLQPRAPKPRAAPRARTEVKQKPPSVALKKGTWFVENYSTGLVPIEEIKMKHSVYLYNCSNCTIQIPDKCKSIQVDKCKKIRVFFKKVVSVFEIINSERVQVFIEQGCPSVTVDKSSGVNVVVLKDAVNEAPNVVYESSSEINITVPPPSMDDNDDPIEHAVLTQFQASLVRKDDGTYEIHSTPIKHSD